jgi:hypothetical protein
VWSLNCHLSIKTEVWAKSIDLFKLDAGWKPRAKIT